ncbi:MAG: hypothetical protein J0M02_11070 [Planctomycetes bacterium]|nr:hypothetical protein [Planctomycetota bacterium]
MIRVTTVLLASSLLLAADPAMPPQQLPQQQAGISSMMILDKPLDWSGKIDGFIKVENAEIVMHVSIDEIVAVHRFVKDTSPQSIIVLSRPLVMGRNDTFLLVPDQVMKFEKVLNFIDSVRKNRAVQK